MFEPPVRLRLPTVAEISPPSPAAPKVSARTVAPFVSSMGPFTTRLTARAAPAALPVVLARIEALSMTRRPARMRTVPLPAPLASITALLETSIRPRAVNESTLMSGLAPAVITASPADATLTI